MNLIDNACKYSVPNSEIAIGLEDVSVQTINWWIMTISNLPGKAGMPDADKIFSKYYRADHARETMGSGLGLFLAGNLAKIIGAELRYVPTIKDNHQAVVKFQLCLPQ